MPGGIQSGSALGSLTNSRTIGLVGQVVNVLQGEFEPRHGQVMFLSQGTLTPRITLPALTSPTISGQQGFVGASVPVGDVTVHLSGEEIVSSQGILETAGQALVGNAINSATGIVVKDFSVPLVGSMSSAEAGLLQANLEADDTKIIGQQQTVVGDFEVLLVGAATIVEQGLVSTDEKRVELSGQAADVMQGAFLSEIEISIAGNETLGLQTNVLAPGEASLAGELGVIELGTLVPTRGLSGQLFSATTGILVPTVPLMGQGIVAAQGEFGGVPKSAALIGQGMVAESGNLGVTGFWTEEPETTKTWTKDGAQDGTWTEDAQTSGQWTKEPPA